MPAQPLLMKKPSTPTMREIADAAGVSTATVSLCLRNHPRFPQETCERIQGIAKEMGYRPNPLVSTLMAHLRAIRPPEYAATIGLINAFHIPGYANWSPSCRSYYEGARARAEQMGYRLDEFWIHEPGMTTKRLNKMIYVRGVAGLLVGPVPLGRGHLNLDWANVSAATIGHSLWHPNLHRVAHNQFRAMCLIMRKLNRLGYRRIGLTMSVNFDERSDHNWLAGFLVGQHRHGNETLVPPLIHRQWNVGVFSKWLKEHRPDVVVCPHLAALEWLKTLRIRVPDDVGFVHLDWASDLGAIAGIDQRPEMIGAAAIESIVGQIHRNERGIPPNPKLVLMDGEWVDGNTVRKVSDSERAARVRIPSEAKARTRVTTAKRSAAKAA